MHLKSLEIQGFKSFPDKISIKFPDGITAIVGPNGSGKSNISDAIRWVLGEQSGKQLRSAKMEDVIFTGTTKRRPQGFAQVGLTIDNADHALPVEYNEVTVSRRYYRSGESEYYINNQQVRLKDVNELFLDTGLGKDGYSIIGQGKIAEILSPKSEDRRAIIEEVAGISKYRYRRNEAGRKLQATEDNLVRLYDILNELSDRLPQLENQSEKARKYLAYRDEKTTLDISLWMDEIDHIQQSSEKLREDFALVNGNLEDITTELTNIEKDIGGSFGDNQKINMELEEVREQTAKAEEQIASLQSAVAVLDNQIAYMKQDIAKAETEIGEIDDHRLQIAAQIEKAQADVAAKRADITASQEEMAALYERLEKLSATDDERRTKSEALRAEITRLTTQKNDVQMERISAETQLNTVAARKAEAKQALAEKQPQYDAVSAEIGEIDVSIADCKEKLTEFDNMAAGIDKLAAMKQNAYEQALSEYEKAKAELAKLQNRKQLLLEMERSLEGYQGSVKTVLRQAESGRLSGICGTLSKLIDVPQQYIAAIETALGAAIQNIVTETEKDAKKAIFLLKSQNAGRVTMLPLDTIRVNRVSDAEFKNQSGFLGVAADLIQTKYPKAVEFLLGRTLVVDTLDHATELSAKCGRRFKIVTLDGQVVNVGGSLTGGSVARSAGLLSRNIEVQKAEELIALAEKKCRERDAAMIKSREEHGEMQAKLEGLRAERQTVEEQSTTLGHLRENKSVVLESFGTVVQNLKDELSQIDGAEQLHGAHIEQCAAQTEILQKRIEQSEAGLAELENISGQNAGQAEKIKEEIAACQLRQAEIFKEIEGVDNIILQYQTQLSRVEEDNRTRQNTIEENRKSLAEAAEQHASLESMLAAGKQSIADLTAKNEQLIARRTDNEKQQTQLRAMQKEKLSVKEKLLGESARLEHKLTNILDHSETLIAKLMDEYNLTVSEARERRVALENPGESKKRAVELRNKMRALGNVNLDAIEEYKEVKKRHDFLQGQVDDLTTSKRDLEKLISELLGQMKSIFTESFYQLNEQFNEIFKELFGGGRAELILSDPEDVLNCNIEIKVAPPGKIIKSILSLSGGEQAFSAIALYFAILKIRPTPFCIMDEIEAALDDVNVARFASYLRRFCSKTQFITITHRRGTMEEADVLYGVTMQEKGVSKLLTINVGEMEKYLKLK